MSVRRCAMAKLSAVRSSMLIVTCNSLSCDLLLFLGLLRLLHLQPLICERQLFHGYVTALGVEGPAHMLDDACTQQLPGDHHRSAVFILQLDRNRAKSVLITVAYVVEPLVQVQ